MKISSANVKKVGGLFRFELSIKLSLYFFQRFFFHMRVV
jgi:hypothetical protein